MAIKNPNGSVYRTAGMIQHFDPDNPEHYLFNRWDQEAIKIGGSPLFYYEVIIPTGKIDTLYLECRAKLFANFPVELWGFYEPVPPQNYQNAFGLDAPDEMIFEMNYRDVLKRVGHPPKIGSRIYTPHKREDWVVIQRNPGEWQMWGEIRIQLLCQRFQESITTQEGTVTQMKPDFQIN